LRLPVIAVNHQLAFVVSIAMAIGATIRCVRARMNTSRLVLWLLFVWLVPFIGPATALLSRFKRLPDSSSLAPSPASSQSERPALHPIFKAIDAGETDVIRTLLKENPQLLYLKNPEGGTLLAWAAGRGRRGPSDAIGAACHDFDTIKALLDKDPRLAYGEHPIRISFLPWAAMYGRKDVVELLLAKMSEIGEGFGDIQIALRCAASREVAELLIAHGADVNGIADDDEHGNTPLLSASLSRPADLVELLLAHHARVNVRNSRGVTPLLNAAYDADPRPTELLLSHGADVTVRMDENGQTPLHIATRYHRAETVKLLLAHHADVHAKDNLGKTPLHLAVTDGDLNLVKILIDHHSEINARDAGGRTPLQWAIMKQKTDIAALLREHDAEEFTIASVPGEIALPAELVAVATALEKQFATLGIPSRKIAPTEWNSLPAEIRDVVPRWLMELQTKYALTGPSLECTLESAEWAQYFDFSPPSFYAEGWTMNPEFIDQGFTVIGMGEDGDLWLIGTKESPLSRIYLFDLSADEIEAASETFVDFLAGSIPNPSLY
jgi:ankyrin repeat protein